MGAAIQLGGGTWQRRGQPQENLPFDDTPGLATNAFLMLEAANDIVHGRIPFWDDPPNTLDPSNAQFTAWDIVTIGGQVLPGICIVRGKRGKRFDVKKKKGSDFATLTKQGYEPAEISIVNRIWTRQQLHALELMMPMLEAPTQQLPDGTLQALEIRHPALDLRNINAMVIKDIGLLGPGSTKGVMEQTITCLEYKPPKKTNSSGTVKGATMYNVPTQTNQRFSKGPNRPTPPFTNTGPNGGRGG